MIIQGRRDTVYDGVYGGFAASQAAREPRAPPTSAPPWPAARDTRPRRRVSLAVGGALAAVVLGVAFGWVGRPDLARRDTAPPSAAPTAVAPGAVELRPAAQAASPPPEAAPAPVEERFVPPPPPPLPKVERATAAPSTPHRLERATTAPARRVQPAFHCDWALRPSEQMVCNDAELAALDNRLNRAFTAAVRAGVPRPMLRREQDGWMRVREAAARDSRGAVEDLYRERIAELDDLARGP